MLHSNFVRHVATLMSGKASSQIISIIAVPVIARLFDPDDFGVMAVFVAVVTILATMAPLRYFRAALLEKDEWNANGVLAISLTALLFSCFLLFLVISASRLIGLELIYADALGLWVWFVPVGVFLVGLSQIVSTIHVRNKRFRSVAISDVSNASVTAITRIVIGQAGSSIGGLMTGYFAGEIARLMVLVRSLTGVRAILATFADKPRLRLLARQYSDFPLYNMPTGLMTGLSMNLPVLLMGLMFAPEIVGFYAMADRLVRKPLGVMNKPIQDVFMVKGSAAVNRKDSLKLPLLKVTSGLFLVGIIPFSLLTLFGQDLLGFVLGSKWKDAGLYVQILAPWYFSTWVTMAVRPVMVIHRRQAGWLVIQISALLIRALVFITSYVLGLDVFPTLVWFAAVNVVIAIAVLLYSFYVISRADRSAAAL